MWLLRGENFWLTMAYHVRDTGHVIVRKYKYIFHMTYLTIQSCLRGACTPMHPLEKMPLTLNSAVTENFTEKVETEEFQLSEERYGSFFCCMALL